MSKKQHHLVPNKNGGWDVKRAGATRASVHTNTKAEEERLGRALSRKHNTEFVVHGLDGKIQRADSHGNDPCPPVDNR